jgi:branched-chain amino acid transport system ATP-binding protein
MATTGTDHHDAGDPMFRVQGLRSGYGAAEVLHGVDLSVSRGEAVAVLGPNGAGKTTLLRSIFSTCRVLSGSITLDGTDLLALPNYQVTGQGIGHVPEGRGLFPEMSVTENLTVGGLSIGSRLRSKERMDEVIEIFPVLGDRRTQIVGTMSGGEQQMVAIARALMAQPRLLVLDEPSLGLAPRIVDDIFARLSFLSQGSDGMALLVVEQRVQEALDLCDRAYVLEGGSLLLEGPSSELNVNELLVEAFFGRAAGSAAQTVPLTAPQKGGDR